ncbi:hypothetical protein VT84_00935 [Gemmata sp. SH-PL17]|uniref:hypothetical protein n=1 Tax=Gemmata sp. SH-PL17 TaxID=1630693 RepID=UPI00078CE508|nr:hypothetical protein [Gemmata sp. SH-PL17]AMV22943.1 hypothetical protein VT84_00935 [Gemmata sp. SH-PL17]
MTEDEWLTLNAGLMLNYVEQNCNPSPRKLRLLATVYARFLETQPEYADSKHVAHLGDEIVDGGRTLEELWDQSIRGWGYDGDWAIANLVLTDGRIGNTIRMHLAGIKKSTPDSVTRGIEVQQHCAVLRPYILCILDNPFRPVAFDPAWRTSDVVALAQGIYADRAFDRMPILADALQEAGCDNTDVLTHCRADTVHARGCWVVDGVLGKA